MLTGLLPLFPLPRLVLLPGLRTGLHIFEARYRALVSECLAGDSTFILVRSRLETDTDRVPATAPVFEVGTRVRIAAHETLPEGRFNILVEGIEAARLLEEVDGKPYRQARWLPVGPDFHPLGPLESSHLTTALDRYLKKSKNNSLIMNSVILDKHNKSWVPRLAASLNLPLPEQQFLLESESHAVMADRLVSLLEFAVAGRTPGTRG